MNKGIVDGLKLVSVINLAFSVLASLVSGIVLLSQGDSLGVGIILLGIWIAVTSTMMLYGFAVLIEKAIEISNNTRKTAGLAVAEVMEKTKAEQGAESVLQDEIRASVIKEYQKEQHEEDFDYDPRNEAAENECPACFFEISSSDEECPRCGHKLK